MSKFENFSQPFDLMGNRLNLFNKFFLGGQLVGNWLTGFSRLLANGSVFGIFGALFLVGLSPCAPDRFGERF